MSDTEATVYQFALDAIGVPEAPDAKLEFIELDVIMPYNTDTAFAHMYVLDIIIPFESDAPPPPDPPSKRRRYAILMV